MTTTTYTADRTTLLIVDPYNDCMSAGGKLYEATKETAAAVGFYDNMRTLIPGHPDYGCDRCLRAGRHAAHEVNGPRFAHAILTTEELLALLPY